MPLDTPESAPLRRSRRPLDADPIASPSVAPQTRRAAREARTGSASVVPTAAHDAAASPRTVGSVPAPAAPMASGQPATAATASAAPTTAAIPVVPAAGDRAVTIGFDAALRALGNAEPARESGRAPIADAAAADSSTAHVVPPRARRSSVRRVATIGATVGVMGIAGLLAVSMTLPAQAVAAVQGGASGAAATTSLVVAGSASKGGTASDQIQAFIAPTQVHDVALQGAQGFTAMSSADLAAEEGIRFSDSLYTNDTTAKIQWPFIVGVAMSSPYGMRDGVMHQGIDLIPGEGAPIQAIADGTVRLASESDGGYGVGVYIDHVIDGQPITSHYGHMQYGSLRVKTGDPIKVGDIIGLTGNTGHSFGAHLHFELYVNGSTIDPLPWMLAHAGRH